MPSAPMATFVGTAVLLCFMLRRRNSAKEAEEEQVDGGALSKPIRLERRRLARRPARPPSTWQEAVATVAKTIRFTYSETLGKWSMWELAFGIKCHMRRKGILPVASIYAGSSSVQLKGPEVLNELIHLLKLMNICILFSKKPFPLFLGYAGYSQDDVLLQKPKAGFLKPAFTILRDKRSKCFILIVRGMHSIKDTLTAATGAVVPFHHSVLHEGAVSKLVLGYAHCGMVAAAQWIAKCTTPCLLRAVNQYPAYNIKIVGNSLGGGIAALLTFVLREHIELSSSTCISFAPAACMTWDLAESGKNFITTIINGSDLVPTCSLASLDTLRSEVTPSPWLTDIRDQFQHMRFLNAIRHSMFALRSHIPFISSGRPVSSEIQVARNVQNATQDVDRSSSLYCWSCIGARRRAVRVLATPKESARDLDREIESLIEQMHLSCSRVKEHEGTEGELMPEAQISCVCVAEEMGEGERCFELERVEVAAIEEIEEEYKQSTSSDAMEKHHFFPPGRIMHIIEEPASDPDPRESVTGGRRVGIYETPRDLYGTIRLSQNMIKDHYMPMYKKMMELLIDNLSREED